MVRTLYLATAVAALIAPAAAQPASGFRQFDEPVQTQFRFNSNIMRPRYEAIRGEREWDALWDTATSGSAPPQPQIDFSREMLLLAAMGARSSGGYSVRITLVRETRDALVATVLRTNRGPRCGAIAAITEPADIVRVRATTKPVRWIYRDVTSRC